MTSLALAAHAAAAQPGFNRDFYAAAATIIPVLFLAVTIQGRAFEQLSALNQKVLPWFAAIVFGSGCIGELYAITALYRQAASTRTSETVLGATIILIVAVTLAGYAGLLVVSLSSRKSPASPENPGAPVKTAGGAHVTDPGTTPGGQNGR